MGKALIDAVDGVVLVIRWEKTHREAVLSAIRQSHGIGDKLFGRSMMWCRNGRGSMTIIRAAII